jgi:hypothetical protein
VQADQEYVPPWIDTRQIVSYTDSAIQKTKESIPKNEKLTYALTHFPSPYRLPRQPDKPPSLTKAPFPLFLQSSMRDEKDRYQNDVNHSKYCVNNINAAPCHGPYIKENHNDIADEKKQESYVQSCIANTHDHSFA